MISGKRKVSIFLLILFLSLEQIGGTGSQGERSLPASNSYSGTVYYVDPGNGSDSNDGQSPSSAWRTIQRVNEADLGGGDAVLFKRGTVSHSSRTLVVMNGGSHGSPLTFGSFGQGRNPILDFDNSSVSGVECYSSHVIFENLTLTRAGKQGLAFQSFSGGTWNIELRNLFVHDVGANGIMFMDGGGNITISNVTVSGTGNSGIALMGSYRNKLSNVTVEDCRIRDILSNDGLTIHEGDSTSASSAGSGFVLRNNLIENCFEEGFDITTGSNILMVNNTSRNNRVGGIQLGHSAHDIIIRGHRSIDEGTGEGRGAGLLIYVSNVTVENSIFTGGTYHSVELFNPGEYPSVSNVTLQNNIFIHGGKRDIFSVQHGVEEMTVVNNIFISGRENQPLFQFLDPGNPPSRPRFFFDNNIYWTDAGVKFFVSGSEVLDLDDFRSQFGQEINGSETDPGLGDDFFPEADSPVIDAGLEGFTTFDTLHRPVYNRRDIGPFEFVPRFVMGEDSIPVDTDIAVFEDGRFDHYRTSLEGELLVLSASPLEGWSPEIRGPVEQLFSLRVKREDDGTILLRESPSDSLSEVHYELYVSEPEAEYDIVSGLELLMTVASDLSGLIKFDLPSDGDREVSVMRRVLPYITDVIVPSNATTGDPFQVSLRATSHIGLDSVKMEMKHSGGEPEIVEMEGGPYFDITVIPSMDSLDPILLRFIVTDMLGSSVSTQYYRVNISDNDPPHLFNVTLPERVGTGDDIGIEVQMEDNIRIDLINIEYGMTGGATSIRTVRDPPSHEIFTIQAPRNRVGAMDVLVSCLDTSGNRGARGPFRITVFDNDPPWFGEIQDPERAYRGTLLELSADIYDNIGLTNVELQYRFDEDEMITIPLEGGGPTFSTVLRLPSSDDIDDLYFRYRASDGSSGLVTSALYHSKLVDKTFSGEEIWFTSPGDGDTLSGTFTISLAFIGAATGGTLELYIDGSIFSSSPVVNREGTFSIRVDSTTLADGPHVLHARLSSDDGRVLMESVDVTILVKNIIDWVFPERILITERNITVTIGSTHAFTVTLLDENGEVVPLPETHVVRWSLEGEIGTILPDGTFIAEREGAGWIQATMSSGNRSISDRIRIEVVDDGKERAESSCSDGYIYLLVPLILLGLMGSWFLLRGGRFPVGVDADDPGGRLTGPKAERGASLGERVLEGRREHQGHAPSGYGGRNGENNPVPDRFHSGKAETEGSGPGSFRRN